MTDKVKIDLQPLGASFEIERGILLRDSLFPFGVEFPCGGRGQCKGCRVKVLSGQAAVTAADEERLTAKEIADGWRLACQCKPDNDLILELAQWQQSILEDETRFEFTPREGLGVAIDLGTTTLATQLLDLETGQVMAVRAALNPQARSGADVMSRVGLAGTEKGRQRLESRIRGKIGEMVLDLCNSSGIDGRRLVDVTMVGNTAMHHLFCGVDVEPLSRYPFEPTDDGPQSFVAEELGWKLPGNPPVRFLPCLGGFVGSDILAGLLAMEMHESDELVGLIDLGTNGEIILGNRERMVCCSTAAGPAFEGALISQGMRAATGAISEAWTDAGGIICHTIGDVEPRGICGSGLVDVIAAGLDLEWILPSGRIASGQDFITLSPAVQLTQTDIRQTQLAKGAIAAGTRILLNRLGATYEDVSKIYLSGAFGNYINQGSAKRIGLIEFPLDDVDPAGNTALRGAKMALFHWLGEESSFADVRNKIEHVPLSADPEFQDIYVEKMTFPGKT